MKYLNQEKLTQVLANRTAEDTASCHVGATGLCVMQDGKVIYKAYNGKTGYPDGISLNDENGDKAIFRLASMTKPVTAVAVLIQVARGKLGLDQPITDFLPQFANMMVGELQDGKAVVKEPARRILTPRMLLSHQNGMVSGPLGDHQGYGTPEQKQDLEHVVDYFSTLLLDFQPTEAQFYSATAAFDIWARLVEITSGMDYNTFVHKEIFEPLGMTDTTFLPTEEQWSRFVRVHTRKEEDGVAVSANGPEFPGCIFSDFPVTWFSGGAGLCSTLPDYVKFAEMLVRDGRLPDGTALVPEELIREMRTPWVPYEIMPVWERWGLGVRVITGDHPWLPLDCFGWSGAYGSHFWVDPNNKISAVYMKNSCVDGGAGSQTSVHFEQDVYACLE